MTSAPKSSPVLRRFRAERMLRSDFTRLRSQVLAVVRARLRAQGIRLDPADLEACYAQAWSGLYATVLDGREVDNPSGWLVLVTFRRAIDESRSAAHRPLVEETMPEAGVDPDLAGSLDDRRKLQQVLEGLRSRLSPRECEAASLCYLQGLTRVEAAARMGLGEARMRKLMDGAGPGRPGLASKVGTLLDTIRTGAWCEQQGSLMRAYAFGVLDPDGPRHALAVLHCRECPACRAYVATLRGLAVVLPPLPLRLLAAGAGTAAGTSAGSGSLGASGGAPGAFTGGASLSGGVGSLAAKLAVVVGALAVGVGGYAALAGASHHRAPRHGSPRVLAATRNAGLAGSPYQRLYEDHFARPFKPKTHARRPTARRATRTSRFTAARTPPSESAAREFGPERTSALPSPSARSSTPSNPTPRNASGAGEFGFE